MEEFETDNADLAATIQLITGFSPTLRPNKTRLLFVFPGSVDVERAAHSFETGVMVDAKLFAEVLNTLHKFIRVVKQNQWDRERKSRDEVTR